MQDDNKPTKTKSYDIVKLTTLYASLKDMETNEIVLLLEDLGIATKMVIQEIENRKDIVLGESWTDADGLFRLLTWRLLS